MLILTQNQLHEGFNTVLLLILFGHFIPRLFFVHFFTTAVAQLVECSLRMWKVGVRIPAGSDQDFKNGSDCSFAKHSAIRNESHGSFGRDFKPRSRVTAGVAR